MADWLKLNHPLVRSAKVRRLARALNCSKLEAFGLMVSWLILVDEQTTNGCTGAFVDDIEDELGRDGAVDGLISIGWAELDAEGIVCAVDFGKHCGDTAKARALNARNNQTYRARKSASKNHAPVIESNHAPVTEERHAPVTESSHEKRKEENRKEKKRIEENRDEAELNGSITQQGELPMDSPPPPSAPSGVREALQHMRALPHAAITEQELRACAEKFCLTGQASGWTYKNAPLRDWRASAALYLSRWQENARKAVYSRSNTSLQGNIYDS